MRRTYYPSHLPKPTWSKVYDNHAPTLKVEAQKEQKLEAAPVYNWFTPVGFIINVWNVLTGDKKPL